MRGHCSLLMLATSILIANFLSVSNPLLATIRVVRVINLWEAGSDEDRFLRGGLDTSSFIHTADRSRGCMFPLPLIPAKRRTHFSLSHTTTPQHHFNMWLYCIAWQNGGYDDGYGHEGRLFGGSFHEENGTAHNLPPLNSQPPTSWNATETTTGHTFLQQVSEAGIFFLLGNSIQGIADQWDVQALELRRAILEDRCSMQENLTLMRYPVKGQKRPNLAVSCSRLLIFLKLSDISKRFAIQGKWCWFNCLSSLFR